MQHGRVSASLCLLWCKYHIRSSIPPCTNSQREERANVLLGVSLSNSFEGAVGLSVSPPPWPGDVATRRRNPGQVAGLQQNTGLQRMVPLGARGGGPAADSAAGLGSGSPRDVCVFARKTLRPRSWRRSCRVPPPRPPVSSTRHPPPEVAVTAAPHPPHR